MNGRPPKGAIAVWVLGILCAIAQTLNAYHFRHNDIIGVLIGLALAVVWIIWAILVWHQEIVEFWLRIRGRIMRRVDPETHARAEFGNFKRCLASERCDNAIRYNKT